MRHFPGAKKLPFEFKDTNHMGFCEIKNRPTNWGGGSNLTLEGGHRGTLLEPALNMNRIKAAAAGSQGAPVGQKPPF